jgi:hypothetical protein
MRGKLDSYYTIRDTRVLTFVGKGKRKEVPTIGAKEKDPIAVALLL